jgi:hypothetical protein
VDTANVLIVTKKVFIITAAKPKGAISNITRVMLPVPMETKVLRVNAVREEIYIFTFTFLFYGDLISNLTGIVVRSLQKENILSTK